MYIRKNMVEKAKASIRIRKCSVDFQIDRKTFVKFGFVGLTVTKVNRERTVSKTLNGWQDMSITEINRQLTATPWEEE